MLPPPTNLILCVLNQNMLCNIVTHSLFLQIYELLTGRKWKQYESYYYQELPLNDAELESLIQEKISHKLN